MSTTKKSESAAKKDVTKLQRAIVDGLEDVKAQDIQVFNTEHLSPLFERVIVASGTSNRQTKALAGSVKDAVKEAGFDKPRVEGEDNGEWIIVDCGPVVAHIMQPVIRQYYRLEEIWGEMPVRVKLGSAKPRLRSSEDAEAEPKKKPVARKRAAAEPEAAPKAAPKKRAAGAGKASAGAVKASKPAAKKTTGKAPAKSAVKSTPKPAPKKPASKAVVKTVVVNKPAAKKAPAKKAPARKTAAK
ncbi:MAG: ribosome silencing factor [Comamonas sp.]